MKGNSYFTRRIHSLLGVIPLSLFIIQHSLINFSAYEGGPDRFESAVKLVNDLPLVTFLEIFGIFIPLIFHGVYGLYIAYQSNANVDRYGYGRNWAFVWQRISGVITFIFVFWHVYQTRFQVWTGNISHDELGSTMNHIANSPFYFVLYVVGVIAAVYHFANGMWSFLVSWGITVGPKAQRVSSYVWMTVFVIVTAFFLLSLFAFRGDEFKEASAAAAAVRNLI